MKIIHKRELPSISYENTLCSSNDPLDEPENFVRESPVDQKTGCLVDKRNFAHNLEI